MPHHASFVVRQGTASRRPPSPEATSGEWFPWLTVVFPDTNLLPGTRLSLTKVLLGQSGCEATSKPYLLLPAEHSRLRQPNRSTRLKHLRVKANAPESAGAIHRVGICAKRSE